jgi:hypothetical protein
VRAQDRRSDSKSSNDFLGMLQCRRNRVLGGLVGGQELHQVGVGRAGEGQAGADSMSWSGEGLPHEVANVRGCYQTDQINGIGELS